MLLVLLPLLGILLASCSSAQKRAKEMMEQGLFEEAAQSYEKLAAENPGDAEIAAGLVQSRQGLLGQRLIEVRKLRQSGSPGPALDLLLATIAQEAQWKTTPPGAAAFTQEEERSLALPYAREQVRESLKAGFPLKAEHFALRIRPALDDGQTQAPYQALRAEIRGQGRARCDAFQKEKLEGRPHYARFVASFCRYWGVRSREIPADRERALAALYGEASFTSDGVYAGFISESFENAFGRTAWFDSAGKRKLEATVRFAPFQSHLTSPQPLTHVYTERVPYTDYVDERRTRYVTEKDAVTGRPVERPVTYLERVPVTRYRDEHRTLNFSGIQHTQTLKAELSSQFEIAGHAIRLLVSQASETTGIEHHENQPGIGLTPATPNLPDADKWFREQIQRAARDLEAQAVAAWVSQHCREPEDASLGGSGDSVARCLRQPTPIPAPAAEAWYQRNLGLSVEDAGSVLSR
jgi:hypothetical protein